METIYELIKKNSVGKGEDIMWKSTAIISDAVEHDMSEDAKKKLYNDLYGLMSNGHYNEDMALCDVEKMYYEDSGGSKHYAPYLTAPAVKEEYNKIASKINEYNEWDFYVTLHMIVSDYHNLMERWFPEDSQEERIEKYVELAVNWLDDDDWPENDRIWAYLH